MTHDAEHFKRTCLSPLQSLVLLICLIASCHTKVLERVLLVGNWYYCLVVWHPDSQVDNCYHVDTLVEGDILQHTLEVVGSCRWLGNQEQRHTLVVVVYNVVGFVLMLL